MGVSGKKRRSFWQKSGLLLIFMLFMTSGLFRIGSLDFAQAAVSGDQGRLAGYSAALADTDPGQCAPIEPLHLALTRVEGRAEALDQREEHLDQRAQSLHEAEQMLAVQLATLEATEERLESLLALSDTAAESDLARLTQVYETMDSADAAALFAQMDPGFAAGFLGRMQAEAAAGVLAELEPETAYSFSVLLATRNASAPAQLTD